MILVVAKWRIRPEKVDAFPDAVSDFTAAVRTEPGVLLYEWSRSLDEADTFVQLEGYADQQSFDTHLRSPNLTEAVDWLRDWIAAPPRVIHGNAGDGLWAEVNQIAPR